MFFQVQDQGLVNSLPGTQQGEGQHHGCTSGMLGEGLKIGESNALALGVLGFWVFEVSF